MTNDFKKNILDYVTNNVTQTSGNNVPLFDDTTTIDQEIDTVLSNELGNHNVNGYISNQETQLIIVYGSYSTPSKSYIYLFDKDLNVSGRITALSSGSDIFRLNHLEQAEDGNFYAISKDTSTGVSRILLFNNFTIKINGNYRLILRQSYIVPNTYNLNYIVKDNYWNSLKPIIKVPGIATYFVLGNNVSDSTKSTLFKFVINVGSENEWTTISDSIETSNTYDILTEKITETKYNLYLFYSTYNQTISKYKEMVVDEDNNIEYHNDMQWDLTSGTEKYIPQQIIAKSTTEKYVNISNVSINKFLGKILTGSIQTLYTFDKNAIINILLLDTIILKNCNNNMGQIGILQNDVLYLTDEISNTNPLTYLYAFKSFNLLNIYMPVSSSQTQEWILDYNPTNYNGLSYSDYNQTVPHKARLYSNGEMVFARNLYNRTLLNNTSTSTVQIPNTLLNGTEIDIENLVGETNKVLVSKDTTFTKNIYETVYINFVNNLSVIDEDTSTYYPLAANYINVNVNTGTQSNCEDTFVGKVRINYETPIIQTIEWIWDTDHYKTGVIVDCRDEVPTSIEFISNDETTTYITKTPNFVLGKSYVVKEKLRIE